MSVQLTHRSLEIFSIELQQSFSYSFEALRICSRSDRSTKVYVAKYAKLLFEFVCDMAKQNGERYPPNSLYLLIRAIISHLSETGGEDALNILHKSEKGQVNCYVF